MHQNLSCLTTALLGPGFANDGVGLDFCNVHFTDSRLTSLNSLDEIIYQLPHTGDTKISIEITPND